VVLAQAVGRWEQLCAQLATRVEDQGGAATGWRRRVIASLSTPWTRLHSVSTPHRARPEDRIVAITSAAPGWVARFIDDQAEDEMWVQAVPVWALMQDTEGRTWVAGIDAIGEGTTGRPCDEVGNFHDYLFQPGRVLPMPGGQSPEDTQTGT